MDRILRATGEASQAGGMDPSDVLQEGPATWLLLNGYSQGCVIAAAATAQLPSPVRKKMAVVTMASPLRRLYGITFPQYFGEQCLRYMAADISDSSEAEPATVVKWRNIYRRTDYLGSWLFARQTTAWQPPGWRLSSTTNASAAEQEGGLADVDVLILDPPLLPPSKSPYRNTFSFHRHSAYFADPLAQGVATELMEGIKRLGPVSTAGL